MTASDRNSSTMIFGFVLIVGTILITGTGCNPMRGYEGPARDRSEVAVVRGHGVRFHRVNGRSFGVTEAGVEVLPGQNVFELTIDSSNYSGVMLGDPGVLTMTMNAEAGRNYYITGRRGDGRLCAFPVIAATGDPDLTKPAGCVVGKTTLPSSAPARQAVPAVPAPQAAPAASPTE